MNNNHFPVNRNNFHLTNNENQALLNNSQARAQNRLGFLANIIQLSQRDHLQISMNGVRDVFYILARVNAKCQVLSEQISKLVKEIRKLKITSNHAKLANGVFEGSIRNGEIVSPGRFFVQSGTYAGQLEGDLPTGRFSTVTLYQDNITYRGTVNKGMPEGKGFITKFDGNECYRFSNADSKPGEWQALLPDGSTYEGSLNANEMGDFGKMTFSNGSIYKGYWKDGKFNGLGFLKLSNPAVTYIGLWENGMRHGKGELKYADGAGYIGDWENDKKTGIGKMTYRDHSYYDGTWEDDKYSGQGKMRFSNGEIYIGSWADGLRDGYGKIRYLDGTIYRGYWKNGKRHGKGKLKYPNGVVYTGEWMENKVNGFGKLVYPSGGFYEGNWKDDKKDGPGKQRCEDGSVYDGLWKADMRHGRGNIKFANGNEYDGLWEADKRKGRGTMKYHDGNEYYGEWLGDKPHGQGILKLKDGTVFYVGRWEDGAPKPLDHQSPQAKRDKKRTFDEVDSVEDDGNKTVIANVPVPKSRAEQKENSR